MYDILIVGAGPAGLTAALYACRAGKSVLVIEKATFGGQITYSPKVENIPGFVSLTGNEFAERLVDQCLAQGAEFESAEVTGIDGDEIKTVHTDSGDFTARAVILATGARHRTLGLPGEENFIGEGISFCAVCDGAFYQGKTVGVIGGGNSALQEALLLSDTSRKVVILQNLDHLTGERRLQELVAKKENIEVITGVTVAEYLGENLLYGVRIRDDAGTERDVALDGIFLAVGLVPQNEPFAPQLTLTPAGYAEADESMATRTPGVFVAGDCRAKKIRQVTTAAADGAIAALSACDYLDRI